MAHKAGYTAISSHRSGKQKYPANRRSGCRIKLPVDQARCTEQNRESVWQNTTSYSVSKKKLGAAACFIRVWEHLTLQK